MTVRRFEGSRHWLYPQAVREPVHNHGGVVDDTRERVYDDCGLAIYFGRDCRSDLGF